MASWRTYGVPALNGPVSVVTTSGRARVEAMLNPAGAEWKLVVSRVNVHATADQFRASVWAVGLGIVTNTVSSRSVPYARVRDFIRLVPSEALADASTRL